MIPEDFWLSRIHPHQRLSSLQLVNLGGLTLYGQHQALWKLFKVEPAERSKRAEFLFRCDKKNGLPVFYLLSRRKPMDTSDVWIVESKAYCPDIRKGDQLGFKLRVNPVISKSIENNLRGKRHDVVMNAKLQLNWKEIPVAQRPHLSDIVQEAGENWLRSRQIRLGIEINEDLRVDGYRTWRRQGAKRIELSTLDFEGSLRVTDAEYFRRAMFHGIGPAKSFGCGLLLVRRI